MQRIALTMEENQQAATGVMKRLDELYAVNDQVGFLGTQCVDGKLILPEAMQVLTLGANG